MVPYCIKRYRTYPIRDALVLLQRSLVYGSVCCLLVFSQAWIEDERLYIQTELCETSLEKQLESGTRLDVTGVYAFLRQTLLGLEILHQHNLVHLDIKVGIQTVTPEHAHTHAHTGRGGDAGSNTRTHALTHTLVTLIHRHSLTHSLTHHSPSYTREACHDVVAPTMVACAHSFATYVKVLVSMVATNASRLCLSILSSSE